MQLEIGECFESVNDALNSAVTSLGGFKKVGPALRPELPIDQASGWLRDCLNPGRREKLSPEQFMFILRLSRASHVHAVMNFVAFDAGYRATPVDVESQEAALQSKFIDAVHGLSAIQAQLERIQKMKGAA